MKQDEQGTKFSFTIGEKRHMELQAAIEKRLEEEDLSLFLDTNGEQAIIKDMDGFTIGEWESLSALYTWIRDGGLERLDDKRPELENL